MSDEPGPEPVSALDWGETASALTSAQPWISPAELHGLLCGTVCATGAPPADDAWLQQVWRHGGEDLTAGADHAELIRFRDAAVANLDAPDFGFQLLLPDEDAPLGDRLSGLAAWCGGFLSGFGLAGGALEGREEDAVTAVRDIAAITEVDPDAAETEQSETDFEEVAEYVRMAVLVVLEDRLAGGAGATPPPEDAG